MKMMDLQTMAVAQCGIGKNIKAAINGTFPETCPWTTGLTGCEK
jgi:hypothetical protein